MSKAKSPKGSVLGGLFGSPPFEVLRYFPLISHHIDFFAFLQHKKTPNNLLLNHSASEVHSNLAIKFYERCKSKGGVAANALEQSSPVQAPSVELKSLQEQLA